jgi:hypothetical protein
MDQVTNELSGVSDPPVRAGWRDPAGPGDTSSVITDQHKRIAKER